MASQRFHFQQKEFLLWQEKSFSSKSYFSLPGNHGFQIVLVHIVRPRLLFQRLAGNSHKRLIVVYWPDTSLFYLQVVFKKQKLGKTCIITCYHNTCRQSAINAFRAANRYLVITNYVCTGSQLIFREKSSLIHINKHSLAQNYRKAQLEQTYP